MADVSDDDWGNDSPSSDSYSSDADEWMRTLRDFEKGSGSEMLRQIGLTLRERSTASLDRRSRTSDDTDRLRRRKYHRTDHDAASQDSVESYRPRRDGATRSNESRTIEEHMQTIFTPTPIQLHHVAVVKRSAVEDFGFSLSDGMYEKGVFIRAVRPGSPAHRAGLKAYDRILQVSGTQTQ